MGQKVIPISLRLSQIKKWELDGNINKQYYPDFLQFILYFKKYLFYLFIKSGIYLSNLKIKYKKNTLKIYIYIYQNPYSWKKKKKNIQLKTLTLSEKKKNIELNIKKYFIQSNLKNINNIKLFLIKLHLKLIRKRRRYTPRPTFKFRQFRYLKLKKSFKFFLNCLYTKNANLLSLFLLENLKKTVRHKQYFKKIDLILTKFYQFYPQFLGYKIQLKGRINGSEWSKKIKFLKGCLPLSTISANIQYAYQDVKTPHGICSLKIWLFFKN